MPLLLSQFLWRANASKMDKTHHENPPTYKLFRFHSVPVRAPVARCCRPSILHRRRYIGFRLHLVERRHIEHIFAVRGAYRRTNRPNAHSVRGDRRPPSAVRALNLIFIERNDLYFAAAIDCTAGTASDAAHTHTSAFKFTKWNALIEWKAHCGGVGDGERNTYRSMWQRTVNSETTDSHLTHEVRAIKTYTARPRHCMCVDVDNNNCPRPIPIPPSVRQQQLNDCYNSIKNAEKSLCSAERSQIGSWCGVCRVESASACKMAHTNTHTQMSKRYI